MLSSLCPRGLIVRGIGKVLPQGHRFKGVVGRSRKDFFSVKFRNVEMGQLSEMWEIAHMGEKYSISPAEQLSPDTKNPHARIGINRIVTHCAAAYEKLTKDDDKPPSRADDDYETPLRVH